MILTPILLAGAALLMQPAATPPQPDPAYLEQQRRALSELSAAEGWRTTPSGLKYRVLVGRGTGERPRATDRVMVHYVGRFADGSVFDSSVARREAAVFPLNRVIRGWTEGLQLMSVGERFELAIPAELAYGAGRGPIPGGATLFFKVELIGINPPE
ncbi:MAG TPA: FKBP-type peptidyl-prolyl cis-trans isomerase [Allosphingosinicella sp.]